MNKSDVRTPERHWTGRPLCRHYVAVVFNSASTPIRGRDAELGHSICWALGCLGDREYEVVGAWLQEGVDDPVPAAVFADLWHRGAERVQFAVGGGLSEAADDAVAVFPRSAALPSGERIWRAATARVPSRNGSHDAQAFRAVMTAATYEAACSVLATFEHGPFGEKYPRLVERWRLVLAQWEPLFALPAPRRGLVLACDRTAGELQARLVRAVGRHGGFESQEAALGFVADVLQRAERRMDRDRVGGTAGSRNRRIAPHGGAGGDACLLMDTGVR